MHRNDLIKKRLPHWWSDDSDALGVPERLDTPLLHRLTFLCRLHPHYQLEKRPESRNLEFWCVAVPEREDALGLPLRLFTKANTRVWQPFRQPDDKRKAVGAGLDHIEEVFVGVDEEGLVYDLVFRHNHSFTLGACLLHGVLLEAVELEADAVDVV